MVSSDIYIDIARPRQKVWEYISNVENLAHWQSGILGVTATNGMQEGSQLRLRTDRLGTETSVEMEIIRNDGSSILKARNIGGPVRIQTRYTLSSMPEGTRVQFRHQIETHAVYQLAQDAIQMVSDIRYRADLDRLKEILEASGGSRAR